MNVIEKMRRRQKRKRATREEWISGQEIRRIRLDVISTSEVKVTQGALAAQLVDPATGRPVPISTLSRWEAGQSAAPKWAADKLRELAEKAKDIDHD